MNQLSRISRAPAAAVGAGIIHAMHALAARPDADSPEAWVLFCCTAADEAYSAVLEQPVQAAEEGSATKLLRELCETFGDDPETLARLNRERDQGNADNREAAHQAAAIAFRNCMPKLTGRRASQAYIACSAVALQRGYVTAAEAKALLYTAQLALSAHPSRRAQRGRK